MIRIEYSSDFLHASARMRRVVSGVALFSILILSDSAGDQVTRRSVGQAVHE